MVRAVVHLADRLYSEAVADLLDSAGGIEVAGAASLEGRAAAAGPAPDVIVADQRSLAHESSGSWPRGAGVLLIARCEECLAPETLADKRLKGVVPASVGPLELQTAVKAVARGVAWTEGQQPAEQGASTGPAFA